jgi:hypothetical protein
VSAARRIVSGTLAVAALAAAWALTQPFHFVRVGSTGGEDRLLHTGLTHHSWGLMFIPTAVAIALVALAGAWSARPRARTMSIVASLAAATWSLVVLADGALTDYLMTREAALLGEQVFTAARAVIALAALALGPLSLASARAR